MPICGVTPGGQRDLREPLQHALAIPGVVGFVVEDQLEVGEAEERKRAQMRRCRNAVHRDFQRNRDLLLDLLGGDAGPLGDDLDVVVGHVRIGFHRQAVERNDAPAEQQDGDGQHQQAVLSSAKSTSRRIIDCSTVFSSTSAFCTTCCARA